MWEARVETERDVAAVGDGAGRHRPQHDPVESARASLIRLYASILFCNPPQQNCNYCFVVLCRVGGIFTQSTVVYSCTEEGGSLVLWYNLFSCWLLMLYASSCASTDYVRYICQQVREIASSKRTNDMMNWFWLFLWITNYLKQFFLRVLLRK